MNQHFLNAQANLAGKIAQAYTEFEQDIKEVSGQTPDPEADVETETEVKETEKKSPKAPKKAPKKGPKKPVKPEPEEEPEEEEEEAEEETEERSPVLETEDGEVDLSKMKVPALKKFAKEYGIELSASKLKKDKIIEEILDALYEEADEPEEAETEEEEAEEEEAEEKSATAITVLDEDDEEEIIELNDMKVGELKEFAEEYELEITKKKKAGIIQEIIEQVGGDDEEAEEEEEEEAEEESVEDEVEAMYGLDEMTNDELIETLEAYDLSVKGKRQALVSRIVDAIEDGTIEVEEEGE